MAQGKLSIVATPIGNLQDITLRALETLKMSDIIVCEDTRVSKKLLDHFGIQKNLLSYHHHSDARKVREIKDLLHQGKNIALVTDAGTPGISDPGNALIRELTRTATESSEIIPIPGPSAAIAALSICGFATDAFLFLGFPPHKNKRKQFFVTVAASERTVVFFESGHRIRKCLEELRLILQPERRLVVGRELTKIYETIYRGTATQVEQALEEERGEFVVVVEGT